MSELMIDEKKLVEFESAAKIANFYLKKTGVALNFLGYKDFFEKYFDVKESDIESVYELTKESIMWSNYLSELNSLVNVCFFNKLIKQENSPNEKLEKEINIVKLFKKHLEIQVRYCNLIHSETLKLYKENMLKVAFRSSL